MCQLLENGGGVLGAGEWLVVEEARCLAAGWTVCAEGGGRLRTQDISKLPASDAHSVSICLAASGAISGGFRCVAGHLPSEYQEFGLSLFGPREQSFLFI